VIMVSAGTVADCLETGARRLREAGIPDARREARLILAHAMGLEFVAVLGYPERPVTDLKGFDSLIERRAAREPMSHLTGHREFWSLEFEVTAATLDPRSDSETLVEAALACVEHRLGPMRILDFGTGTGCLLLSLLSEFRRATGLGIDASVDALVVAERNARRLGLADRAKFVAGDWGAALTGRYDLIASNPPYIPTGDIDYLQPEVSRYEPRGALDGGEDGLESYRRLGPDICRLLRDGGSAVVEFGLGQGPAVARLMEAEGLKAQGFWADLAGHDRCLILHKG